MQADLTEPGFLERIEAVTRELDIGLLVSNAGAGLPGEFLSHAHDALLRIVRLNVVAHLSLVHHFARRLAVRGRGGVVLLSAAGALQGLPYMANDSATKAYMLNLGEALHVEFRKRGLHMTVLLPGPTDTPMLADLGFDPGTSPTQPMSAAQCVAEGLAALQANRATRVPGRLNRLLAALMPRALATKLMGHMIEKWVARRASAPALAERL